jgi:hypothetical protein
MAIGRTLGIVERDESAITMRQAVRSAVVRSRGEDSLAERTRRTGVYRGARLCGDVIVIAAKRTRLDNWTSRTPPPDELLAGL